MMAHPLALQESRRAGRLGGTPSDSGCVAKEGDSAELSLWAGANSWAVLALDVRNGSARDYQELFAPLAA